MPIGSDARFPLNTDPGIVPAQPAMRMLVNPPAATPVSAMIPTKSPASSPLPVGSGPASIWNFLSGLFSGGGAAAPQGPAQGMRGLLQQPAGRGAPGTNMLGNPVSRF